MLSAGEYTPSVRLSWAKQIRQDHRFKPSVHSVAAELANAANLQGKTTIGKRRIARNLGMSTRTVQRCLSLLVRTEFLNFTKRVGTTNLWLLTFPLSQTTKVVPGIGQIGLKTQASYGPLTYREPNLQPTSELSGISVGSTANSVPRNSEGQVFESVRKTGSLQKISHTDLELAIAKALGPRGWPILEKLKPWERSTLLKKMEGGDLTKADLWEVTVLTADR